MAENDGKDTDTGREDPPNNDGGKDDDQDEDDDSGEDDGGYTPPSKEEWAKAQRALRKANAEAAKLRARSKGSNKDGDGKDDSGGDTQRDAEREKREKNTAGLLALTSEGVSKDQAKRLVRLLNLDVEFDEFGELPLEDQIEDLKEEFPALFAKEEPRSSTRRPRTSSDRGRDSGPADSVDDKHSAKLLRAAGYR